jgi:galactokinase
VNFENSTAYLDALVDIARTVDGVIGSRLTGGGFGGSTVSLIRTERSAEIVETVQEQYFSATGAKCKPILTRPSQGARLLHQD